MRRQIKEAHDVLLRVSNSEQEADLRLREIKEAAGLTEDENGVSKPTCLEERGYGRCILIAALGILSCTDMAQRLSAPQYSEVLLVIGLTWSIQRKKKPLG
jgi:hypothetical protein